MNYVDSCVLPQNLAAIFILFNGEIVCQIKFQMNFQLWNAYKLDQMISSFERRLWFPPTLRLVYHILCEKRNYPIIPYPMSWNSFPALYMCSWYKRLTSALWNSDLGISELKKIFKIFNVLWIPKFLQQHVSFFSYQKNNITNIFFKRK